MFERFIRDVVEVIGPDSPTFDTEENNEERDRQRGRPNGVNDAIRGFFNLIGPDTPLMKSESERKRRDESDDG